MLAGVRRVLWVGGLPWHHQLIRLGTDRRVEMRFKPRSGATQAEAEADVTRTELLVLWDQEVSEEARGVYDTCRAILVEAGGTLMQVLEAIRSAISSS